MQSHIRKVYACLAVTCHLHFWQNDRDLLRATAVTRGSLVGSAISILFVATNTYCDKSSRQNTSFWCVCVCMQIYFCRDKRNFVATKVLSRLAYFCRDKHVFCLTKVCLSREIFCRDKDVFCRDKHVFIATELLSRQKWYLWQLPHWYGTDTEIIPVDPGEKNSPAAPARTRTRDLSITSPER